MRWELVSERERNGFSAGSFLAMRLFEDPGRQRIRHGEAGKGKRDVCFGTRQSF